jgi:hypothetical protein
MDVMRDIHGELLGAGIPVLSREEAMQKPGAPYLYVNVNVVQGAADYSYTVRAELNQGVYIQRNPNLRTRAATWQPAPCSALRGPQCSSTRFEMRFVAW